MSRQKNSWDVISSYTFLVKLHKLNKSEVFNDPKKLHKFCGYYLTHRCSIASIQLHGVGMASVGAYSVKCHYLSPNFLTSSDSARKKMFSEWLTQHFLALDHFYCHVRFQSCIAGPSHLDLVAPFHPSFSFFSFSFFQFVSLD